MALQPVDIDAEIEALLSRWRSTRTSSRSSTAAGSFIGIVRRRSILVFFRDRMNAVLHGEG